MNRRLGLLVLLSALLASAGDLVCASWKPGTGAVFADGNDGGGRDHGGSSGDDNNSDSGGSDDNNDDSHDSHSDDDGSDDNSDDSGSDDSGSDDGGSSDGGSDDGGSDRGGSGRDAPVLNLDAADGIRLIFTNGSIERILAGTYQRLDRRGRILESRPATRTERNRLRAISSDLRSAAVSGVASAVTVNASRQRVIIADAAGWREMLDNDRYVLTDPNGNIVTRRKASNKDISRVMQFLRRN